MISLHMKLFGNKNSTASVCSDMSKQKRYEALVRALHADIYRYAFWLVKDAAVADDLVQETFLRAWKALDSLQDEKAAKSWLITILRRENARRFERKQFDLVDLDDHQVADSAHTSTEQQMDNELLRRHIEMLADEYREPLVLQVLGGYSGEEIAAMLGLNKNTVMTRLFRARNQLKEALEHTQIKRGRSNG